MKPWVAVIGRFASFQLVSQLVAFATGIIIVRSLPKEDYAYYSIAIALIAAFTMVADSGISAALLSRGAQHRTNLERLGQLFSAAVRFRSIFGLIIAIPTIALLCFLLHENGASFGSTFGAAVLVGLTFVPVLSITIFQNFHRVEMNYRTLQRVTLNIALARAALIAVLAASGVANLGSLLFVGALSSLSGAIYLLLAIQGRISFRSAPLTEDMNLFKANVTKTLPMTFLLVMSEQITTVLITFFGSVSVIAEISALSRFSVAFVIINAIVSDLGAPLVARTPNSRTLLLKRMGLMVGLYSGVAIIGVTTVALLSDPLLAILGEQYAGLNTPLVVIAAGAGALNTAYALNSLNQARNWLSLSWTYAPLLVIWAVLSALLLDLDDVDQAAIMVATLALPALLTQVARAVRGLFTIPAV